MGNKSKISIIIIEIIWLILIIVGILVNDMSVKVNLLLFGGVMLQITLVYVYKKILDLQSKVRPNQLLIDMSDIDQIQYQNDVVERAKDYIVDNPDSGLDLFNAINHILKQDKQK